MLRLYWIERISCSEIISLAIFSLRRTLFSPYRLSQLATLSFPVRVYVFVSGMRSRDIFGRLRLRLRLRGSNPAPAPAPTPSKTVLRLRLWLRLRAKSTGSGGSGSGSRTDDQVLIWALISNTIFKNVKCQNMTSYWLGREFECDFEWVSLKFATRCHPRPLADIREVTDSFGLRCLRLVA